MRELVDSLLSPTHGVAPMTPYRRRPFLDAEPAAPLKDRRLPVIGRAAFYDSSSTFFHTPPALEMRSSASRTTVPLVRSAVEQLFCASASP